MQMGVDEVNIPAGYQQLAFAACQVSRSPRNVPCGVGLPEWSDTLG